MILKVIYYSAHIAPCLSHRMSKRNLDIQILLGKKTDLCVTGFSAA